MTLRGFCVKKGLGFLSSVFILSLIVSLSPPKALAVAAEYWSWTDANPVVASSVEKTGYIDSCKGTFYSKHIAGVAEPVRTCVTVGDKLSFGVMSVQDYSYVISLPLDSKMYKFGVPYCSNFFNHCKYLPESDTLIIQEEADYTCNNLKVFKNFSKRLKVDLRYPGERRYTMNESKPDYMVKTRIDNNVCIASTGPSQNGKWLAVEFRADGAGILNLETFEFKRVTHKSPRYGVGTDPTIEVAASNDGRHLAIAGLNAGLNIIDIDDNCTYAYNSVSTADTCKHSNYRPALTAAIPTFMDAYNPRFNDNGGELSFVATAYNSPMHNVVMRASGYAGSSLDYLAMGDSYTSGEGEENDFFYEKGTNDEYEKCHLSTRSYPFLVSAWSGINPDNMKSVACSSAVMGDIFGGDNYWGQGDRLLDIGDKDQAALMQDDAMFSFIPGRARQMDFVKKYQPKAVTISVGGNDAGMMTKLQSCLGPGTCAMAGDEVERERTADEIKGLYGRLVQLYTEVHEASPNSKIYVIGYPKVIDDQNDCSLYNDVLFNATERKFMNEGIAYLNQVIMAAAKTVGVKYVSVENSLGNHVICGTEKPSAINTIAFGDDIELLKNIKWSKVIGQESFHPNSLGQAYDAEAIYNEVGNILLYNYCADGNIVCPVNTGAPEPSSYWINGVAHNYPAQHNLDFILNKKDCEEGSGCNLNLPQLSLLANSTVQIEIHSTPQSLGEYSVGEDGSLDTAVNIPADLPEGFHTIHILGTSYSGEAIDLYQMINYEKPIVNSSKMVSIPAPISEDDYQSIDENKVDNSANYVDDAVIDTNDVVASDNSKSIASSTSNKQPVPSENKSVSVAAVSANKDVKGDWPTRSKNLVALSNNESTDNKKTEPNKNNVLTQSGKISSKIDDGIGIIGVIVGLMGAIVMSVGGYCFLRFRKK